MGWRRKRRPGLASILRETWLTHKYRRNGFAQGFNYDWAALAHDRISIVNHLLSRTAGQDYLEIGCAGDELFNAVQAGSKVGVDPVRGGTHRMTSDAFFSQNPDSRFDVIFIDGLHLYDQVRRDLVHALAAIRPGGWIALHDMLPRDWIDEHVPQISTASWTGDGWKAAFELAATPSVDFQLVAVDHGVLVVRAPDLPVTLADKVSDLTPRRFAYLYENARILPIIDYPAFEAWVGGRSPGK